MKFPVFFAGLKNKSSLLLSNICSFFSSNKNIIFKYVLHLAPAVFLAVLFAFPAGMDSLNLFDSESSPDLLYPIFLPFEDGTASVRETVFYWPLFLVYFLPLNSLFLILSLFIKDNLKKILYILTFVSLTIYLYCAVVLLVANANAARWFSLLPWRVYAAFFSCFALHAFMAFYALHYERNSDGRYSEYKAIQAESRNSKSSIKTKIILTLVLSISAVLALFTFTILKAYKTMITEAVSDVGKTQAEQTAAVYDYAEGKYEKISAYFDAQKSTNSYSGTPYERIDIIITGANSNVYLEKINSQTELPRFDVFAYTTGQPSKIASKEKSISDSQAREYIRMYQSGSYRNSFVYDKDGKTCKYIYPVTFARKDGRKLVGFSIVTYRQEVLMRQYFKTKVFVFSAIVVFIYLSIVVSFFVSDKLINPLLYLRANVRKTSRQIEALLSKGDGKDRSGAGEIEFSDIIRTKDEIKGLSTEIGNMVSLIKGIVPYISMSTLRHAEKESKRSTVSRDLCFLFTDIRNFTSLCEGMSPRKVVELLNHYLDIETEIILKNGGDIDKYAGDEMMAFFSGAKKEYNACKAAMEIRSAMKEQQELSVADGTTFVSIGIGINSGKVIFGSVGSKTRKDFTSIGDAVNLAARLEGANKVYGSKAIITETVFEKLKDTFICRELDFITVKGKTKPVRIYEILQEAKFAAEKLSEIKEIFEKGLALYREQKWDESEDCFSLCAQKYNDMPSVVFIDRIRHFKENPPATDWDGVFKLKSK